MIRSIEYIESVVCAEEGIFPEILHTKSRRREFCEIRQMVMSLALLFGNGLHSAGCFYGRDHATAVHARKVINNLCLFDRNVRTRMDKYYEIIKEGKDYQHGYLVQVLSRLKRETRELSEQLEKIAI